MWIGTASIGAKAQPSIAEQLAGKQPQTQFGRAMEALGIKLILANSPQAKGRVERMNGTLQDRLVKELRLAGISDMESANRFLDGKYLRAFNRQFGRAAASPLDAHRKTAAGTLKEVLSWEAERVVQGDWTVACEGKRYQLDQRHEALSLVRRKVIVRTLRNGRVQLVYRGQPLKWRALPAGSVRKPRPVKKAKASGKRNRKRRRRLRRRTIRGGGMAWEWGGSSGTGSRRRDGRCGWRCGTPVGLRYAPASLRPAPPAGETEQRKPNHQGDILS